MAGRSSRLISAAAAVLVVFALLCGASTARAAGPTVPTVVLGGHLYPKPYGDAYVYGHAELPDSADQSLVAAQTVTLYSSNFPFTGWVQVATLTTDFEGYFSYHTSISQNTEYRAIWQTATPVQSKDKLVKLPLKLSLRASHTRVHKKGVVTFTGASAPAHPGSKVLIQQMDHNGYFKTISSTTVTAASTYSSRVRLRRGGVFRALFGGDNFFGVDASRPVRVAVGKR
jgi:hypothetical protein